MPTESDTHELRLRLNSYYKPPSRWQRRPKFNPKAIEEIISYLDKENNDRGYCYRKQLAKRRRKEVAIYWIAIVLFTPSVLMLVYFSARLLYIASSEAPIGRYTIYALVVLALYLTQVPIRDVYFNYLPRKFDRSFFRFTSQAEQAACTSPVRCFSFGGKAAQALYKSLQGSNRSWIAPPLISDRALELAYPLINIDTDCHDSPTMTKQSSCTYAKFIHYSSALVFIDRCDLIPKLREVFDRPILRCRNAGDLMSISERDAHFIDPMREYNRWSLIRDYLYPLGTWLSFAVSLAALIVSLSR